MADISSKPNVLILVSIPSCVGMRANYGGARAAAAAYDLLMIGRNAAQRAARRRLSRAECEPRVARLILGK
jgi:hypothetical protein